MSGVKLPPGFRWERLKQDHPRRQFSSGQPEVDDWLRAKAWQHQKKHLSVTKVNDDVKRFYQKWDFEELPGHPYRLFLSHRQLDAMMQDPT